jgi:SpoVK/Ycf46/Vps4 family AAA+-type ATPase
VLFSLSKIRKFLKMTVNNAVLDEFGGKQHLDEVATTARWDQLMDSDLRSLGENVTLKHIIETKVLAPLLAQSSEGGFSASDSAEKPSYSMILFGPPGTAKTTICSSMAYYLGWNFLVIDTAEFLADGLQNIAGRMSYIFDRLKKLENTVILFDEIEEFCLNREDPRLSMESRMLTTAMLTQLNDLRRQASCVFVIATNRLRSFDAAITRPGRIDLQLFAGMPNFKARIDRLRGKLAELDLPEAEIDAVVSQVKDFMSAHWEEHIRFFTFAENEKLLSLAVAMAKDGHISYSKLFEAMQSMLPLAMINGPLKEEYLITEQLTRI